MWQLRSFLGNVLLHSKEQNSEKNYRFLALCNRIRHFGECTNVLSCQKLKRGSIWSKLTARKQLAWQDKWKKLAWLCSEGAQSAFQHLSLYKLTHFVLFVWFVENHVCQCYLLLPELSDVSPGCTFLFTTTEHGVTHIYQNVTVPLKMSHLNKHLDITQLLNHCFWLDMPRLNTVLKYRFNIYGLRLFYSHISNVRHRLVKVERFFWLSAHKKKNVLGCYKNIVDTQPGVAIRPAL